MVNSLAKIRINTFFSQIRVWIHWIVTASIAVFIIFYSHTMQQMTREATSLESAIYTPLSRIGWTVYLCLIIYACLKGYGGPVNWFLSLPQWQPFSRLSYAIYLIHMPIMMMEAASLHRPAFFSARSIVSSQFLLFNFFLTLNHTIHSYISVFQVFGRCFRNHNVEHICDTGTRISNGSH